MLMDNYLENNLGTVKFNCLKNKVTKVPSMKYISDATRRNWERLGSKTETKLQKRANKTNSKKRFIPIERCPNKNVVKWIDSLITQTLDRGWDIASVLRSVAEKLFIENNLLMRKGYLEFQREYNDIEIISDVLSLDVPEAFDLLGTIYQSHQTEGQKNINGSYFTTKDIVDEMLAEYDFSGGKRFLDPCCGSGAFLISLNNIDPNNIYGIDKDQIAVMLAKANLIIHYKNVDFIPNVYSVNFISDDLFTQSELDKIGYFDVVATNPPWGGLIESKEGCQEKNGGNETASIFFIKSSHYLTENGVINFLMPVSILNVKTHVGLRHYILEHLHLQKIRIYSKLFSGVTTQYASLEASRSETGKTVEYFLDGVTKNVEINSFFKTENLTFTPMQDIDTQILTKVFSKGRMNLKQSIWALGIVTGDNKSKLHDEPHANEEKIYTGKEIQPFSLKPAKKYILFDKKQLQQVAKEEFYRAKEKLVYKFISKNLTFAYDDSCSLFLNSANILIPNISGMSTKTVLALLNSSLFQFLYIRLFNEVKILRGNLQELPFPHITESEDNVFKADVNRILSGEKSAIPELDEKVMSFYGLNESEKRYIKEVVNGKIS